MLFCFLYFVLNHPFITNPCSERWGFSLLFLIISYIWHFKLKLQMRMTNIYFEASSPSPSTETHTMYLSLWRKSYFQMYFTSFPSSVCSIVLQQILSSWRQDCDGYEEERLMLSFFLQVACELLWYQTKADINIYLESPSELAWLTTRRKIKIKVTQAAFNLDEKTKGFFPKFRENYTCLKSLLLLFLCLSMANSHLYHQLQHTGADVFYTSAK